MGLFISVFTLTVVLVTCGYFIGKNETVKTVKSKGLEEVDGKTYKYF